MSQAPPSVSSVRLLMAGPDALAVRLDLADSATRTLDLQYYLWHNDQSGALLAHHILAAADRGVQVRLLLDDIDTSGRDATLGAFNSHPRIAIKLFNPFRRRWLRPLEVFTRFRELNRRMHNKAMVRDGRSCVVGGRNIGDEYFGLHPSIGFDDLDILATGEAATAVERIFEEYWGSRLAVDLGNVVVSLPSTGPGTLRGWLEHSAGQTIARLTALAAPPPQPQPQPAPALRPAAVKVLADSPEKSWSRKARKKGIAPQLGRALSEAREEVLIVSPYFVPRRGVLDQISALRQRGVQVSVLTNSLASTDVAAVHAGYAPKRRRLLLDGVHLFELKPDAALLRDNGLAKIHLRPAPGRSSLHAKLFVIDRRRCFIGSFNLDPRSARLNTEMGMMVDCPEIAAQAAAYARSLMDTAYGLSLDGSRAVRPPILWSSPTGVTYTKDPHTSRAARLFVHLLSLLPIEAQL